jgi:hypothetical protein
MTTCFDSKYDHMDNNRVEQRLVNPGFQPFSQEK